MKRALITEDDLVSNLLLSALIRGQGYTTVSTYSIKEMSDVLDGEQFDVIFLDNKLGDGMGIDYLPNVRTKQPQAFIVVMSAESFKENVERAFANGANEFLPKPLSHKEIKRVLDIRSQESEDRSQH
jgi:two-component system, NtrC family, response regulator